MAVEKKTMTLNLNEAEMAALERLSVEKDMSKTAVIRSAIRLYELIEARLASGGKLFFEEKGKKEKAELVVL